MQTYDNLETQLTVKDQEMLSLLTAAMNGIIEWRTTDHQANFKYWELYGKLAYLWIELEKVHEYSPERATGGEAMTIPAPFYSENNARIYNGDCLDIMKALPSNSVGLVLTDPPYMIGPISTHNQAFWSDMMNSARLYAEWYGECKRLLRHDGAMWTFLNWKTVPTLIRAATIAELPIPSLMVWDKENRGGGHPAGLKGSYELCALLAKPGFRMATEQTDVWRHRWSFRQAKDHPAEKPVALLKRKIRDSGARGIVLDPFMGSGSTLVAAREMGLPAVGIEQEPKYCKTAIERLGGHYQPSFLDSRQEPVVPPLFPEAPVEPPVPPVLPNGRVLKLQFVGGAN